MKSVDFVSEVLSLAKDQSNSLRRLQAVMTFMIKRQGIPNLEIPQSFVVRATFNDNGKVFSSRDRCSYPPDRVKDKIKIQRANYPGQQVFYCTIPTRGMHASSQVTCILETAWEHIEDLRNERSYVTLSRWNLTRPLRVWVLPFCDRSCQQNDDWKEIRNNMRGLLEKNTRNSAEMTEILTFLSEAFAQRGEKQVYYRITSAFCNALAFYERYTGFEFDGLMYPSANTDGQGINLALKKDLVDNGILKFYMAMMFSLQRHPTSPKNLSVMPASREAYPDVNGRIHFPNVW